MFLASIPKIDDEEDDNGKYNEGKEIKDFGEIMGAIQ